MKKLLLLLPFLLLSCQANNSTPTQTEVNSSFQKNGVLNITVKDGTTKGILSGATVKITLDDGKTLSKMSDNFGRVSFDGLTENNNYNIEVSFADYVTNSISTASSRLIISSNSPASLDINLYKVIGSLTGKIVSEDGKPIESAIINTNNDTGISDKDGNFRVNITNLNSQSVTVAKIGYETKIYGNTDFSESQKNKDTGDIKLNKLQRRASVLFDISHRPFGNDGTASFSKFSMVLQNAGYQVSFENFFSKPADTIDALVLASPSSDYSDDEINNIKEFVRKGKKVVVLGEWGGYGNFRYESMNKLLREANLKINPDVVKETQQNNYVQTDEQIISTTIVPNFVTNNISKLSFYSSASIELIEGAKALDLNISKLLAFNSVSGFRVEVYNKGQFALMGISTIGSGKVIALGDCSLFKDTDIDKNGRSNIDEYDNKKLAENIFAW